MIARLMLVCMVWGTASNVFAEPVICNNLTTLKTSRLTLRKVTHADAPALFFILSNPLVTEHLHFDPYTSLVQVHARIDEMLGLLAQGKPTQWVVEVQESKVVIGYAGFIDINYQSRVGEVSVVLHPDYWGQGIAKEAGFAIVYCGFFAMGLNKVKSCVNEHNARSIALHEKSGFFFEGRLRQEEYKNGVFSDLLVYSLLRDEFITLYEHDIDSGVCTIVFA